MDDPFAPDCAEGTCECDRCLACAAAYEALHGDGGAELDAADRADVWIDEEAER